MLKSFLLLESREGGEGGGRSSCGSMGHPPKMGVPWQGPFFVQALGCAPSAGHLPWALLTAPLPEFVSLTKGAGCEAAQQSGDHTNGDELRLPGCYNPLSHVPAPHRSFFQLGAPLQGPLFQIPTPCKTVPGHPCLG